MARSSPKLKDKRLARLWSRILADPYLVIVLILALAFTAFWTLSNAYIYDTFNYGYFDIGPMVSTFYMHLYHPALASGLQYLVFATHVSPFFILLLPVFAFWSSPITLIVLQNFFLALAAVMAYLIYRDIVKSRALGLIMVVLFILNPGIKGPLIFILHHETFIPFFYLLSFYFFMRGSMRWFVVSYALMLSVMESVPFIGITLLSGLAFYEFVHYKRSSKFDKEVHKRRIKALAVALLVSIAFELFYTWTVQTLLYDYRTGLYASLPPTARVIDYTSIQTSSLLHPGAMADYNQTMVYFAVPGLVMLFLCFGFSSLVDPILTAILIGQWIFEVFYLNNWGFSFPTFQYYLYAIGGAFVGAILGIKIVQDLRKGEGMIIRRRFGVVNSNLGLTLSVGVFCSLILLVWLYISASQYALGFVTNDLGPVSNYTGMDTALESIPANATMMVQSGIYSHVSNHMELELSPAFQQPVPTFYSNTPVITSFYWFRPQYIAFDWKEPDEMATNSFNIYNYMGNNYTIYYNSTVGFSIYKLK